MVEITKEEINKAIAGNDWDLGNKILYDMCQQYPSHRNKSEIIAKVWLIGRSYAAAIERRKDTGNGSFDGDDFYLEKVAPEILDSDIDNWLSSLNKEDTASKDNIQNILLVHLNITELFSTISGLEKRSLASKYLHFHLPNLFFIYDSRAVTSVSHLSKITGRVGRSMYKSDNEYRKYFEKCLNIMEHVKALHGIDLAPRSLDNLLLAIEANA
jgi:hypothetical protein